MYCSKQCRIEAYNSYHRIECRMISFKTISSRLEDFRFTAVRMMLIGTEQGAQLQNIMKKLPMEDIFADQVGPPSKPFVNDYFDALRLTRTYSPSFIRWNTLFVMEIIMVLQCLDFFENRPARQNDAQSQDDEVISE